MATISIDTTPDQDTAAKRLCDRYNAASLSAPVTVVQYAKAQIKALLDGWVATVADEDRITKAQAYQKATPTDQAAVDAILAKYQ